MTADGAGRAELLAAAVGVVVDALREREPDTYRQLVGDLAGERVVLTLLGWGSVGLEVTATDILPRSIGASEATTTCIVSPEVLRDLLAGATTPLEAYVRRSLIVRTRTAHLVGILRRLKGTTSALRGEPAIDALLPLLESARAPA